MNLILAIDPAWTTKEPSAVALLEGEGKTWLCLALAPSYETFLGLADGTPVDWSQKTRFRGTSPDPARLLMAAGRLTGGRKLDLITVIGHGKIPPCGH